MTDSQHHDKIRNLQEGAVASLANARQLVEAAELVRAHNGLPRIAFHLATLAIEEVGKSEILGMGAMALRMEGELPSYVTRGLDDHEKKLFWAMWGPSFASGEINRQQIQTNEGLARNIHETRLRGLYVDVNDSGLELPDSAIDGNQADSLIGMARALVEMAVPRDYQDLPPESLERILWLGRTGDDPTQRAVVFSAASMQKLKELGGNVRDWVDWARAIVDEAEAQARSFAEQEFKRIPSEAGNKPKWELTLRLHTPTHSIRPKSLKWWNDGVERVKLHAVSGKKDELLIKAVLPDGVSAERLFDSGKAFADHILIALNVASVGYFYWFLPPHIETYAEAVIDLERRAQLRLLRPQRMFPDLGHRKVLDDNRLRDAVLVMAILIGIKNRVEAEAFEHYLMALKLIARTDVHLDISGQVFGEFYLCLDKAVEVYEPATSDARSATLKQVLEAQVSDFDEADRFVEFGEQFRATAKGPAGVGLENALKLKILTDVYLLRTLKKIAKDRLKEGDQEEA